MFNKLNIVIGLTSVIFYTSCEDFLSSLNSNPKASFTVNPSSGTTNTTFTFDASGCKDSEDSTSALEVRWNWDSEGAYDTDFSTTKIVTHQYSSPRPWTYYVRLQVKDSGGRTDVITKKVSTNSVPTASFTIDPTSGTIATIFSFDASSSTDNEDSSDVLNVRWDWENDGIFNTEYSVNKTATHQYNTLGVYTVKLEVKDSRGLTNSTTMEVAISNTEPSASFTVEPTSCTTNTTFTFDASSSTDNEDSTTVLQVRWDWENDGTFDTNFSTTKTTTHQFSAPDTYAVKLEVMDSGGLSNAISQTVAVNPINGTMIDIDGNVYNIIQIGSQIWMDENLKVTHYRNGDVIPNITDYSEWYGYSTGAYCSYDNDDSNVSIYGRLYNWYAVDDSRGLSPAGWHIPSEEEWRQLELFLGTDGGSKLKSTSGWSNNGNGTNECGFSAIPAGARGNYASFYGMGLYSHFWMSSTGDF